MRVDLEHEPVRPAVPLDPDPVDDPVVERAAVDPAEQLTQPAARHRLAVDEGGRAAHLLGGDPPPVGQLERDLLPVVGNGQVEIDLAGAGERRRVEHRHRPLGTPAATSAATRSASPEPIWAASPSRTATWSATASAPHPVIESCPEDSTSRRHPSSRNSSGQPLPCSAWSGSA